jgi:hypothetical protein
VIGFHVQNDSTGPGEKLRINQNTSAQRQATMRPPNASTKKEPRDDRTASDSVPDVRCGGRADDISKPLREQCT